MPQIPILTPDPSLFECTECGKCCTQHGQYSYVFVTIKDMKKMAVFLGLTFAAFKREFTRKTDWGRTLRFRKKACIFYAEPRCTIYEARPTQCATWPYWPENMKGGKFKSGLKRFCEGIK